MGLENIENSNSSFQTKKPNIHSVTIRNKTYNLFSDGNDAGPTPLQNKDFPEKNI